jgi:hypothetical protein
LDTEGDQAMNENETPENLQSDESDTTASYPRSSPPTAAGKEKIGSKDQKPFSSNLSGDRHKVLAILWLIPILAIGFVLMHFGASFKDAVVSAGAFCLGLFIVGGAVVGADWLLLNEKTRALVDKLGPQGARLVYVALGFGFIGLALWLTSESIGWPFH